MGGGGAKSKYSGFAGGIGGTGGGTGFGGGGGPGHGAIGGTGGGAGAGGGMGGGAGGGNVGGNPTASPNAYGSGVGGSPGTNSKFNGIPQGYKDTLESRYATGSADAKRVYDSYVPDGGAVVDSHSKDAYHLNGSVYMDYTTDSTNTREAGTTWFHEHGHLVDFKTGWASSDSAFYNALKTDLENMEKMWCKSKHLDYSDVLSSPTLLRQMRRDIGKSLRIRGDTTNGIQDIFGGFDKLYNAHERDSLTKWGHEWSYWNTPGTTREQQIAKEAWAHMFDASFSSTKANHMKTYLPTAFAWFNTRLSTL